MLKTIVVNIWILVVYLLVTYVPFLRKTVDWTFDETFGRVIRHMTRNLN